MRMRLGTGLLVIAFVGALLSGCGSTNKPSTTETSATSGHESSLGGFAQGLCTSIGEWQASTKSTSAKMANSKDDFAQGAQAVGSADAFLLTGIERLGPPPRLRLQRRPRVQSPGF